MMSSASTCALNNNVSSNTDKMTGSNDNKENDLSSIFPSLNINESEKEEEDFLVGLESYLGRYKPGESRWKRLQFIMNRARVGGNLYVTTRILLKDQLQEVGNLVLYRQLFATTTNNETDNCHEMKDDYLKLAESQYVEQRTLCERRYMSILHQNTNLVAMDGANRDTLLRTAQLELAKCHANVGDYATAVHKMLVHPGTASGNSNTNRSGRYNHSNKNNTNSSTDVWSLCLEWAWYGEKYGQLRNFSNKLENQPDQKAKCQAVSGLHHLVRGNFEDATHQFYALITTLQQQQHQEANHNPNSKSNNFEQISSFLSSEDVGLYTALLTLASPPTKHSKKKYSPLHHRQELINLLSKHFISNNSAPNTTNNTNNSTNSSNAAATIDANLIPMELRNALLHFTRAQYGSCLNILKQVIAKHVSYDLYLCPHIHTLWNQICQNIYIFYLQPYSTIRLERFANEFSMPIAKMKQFVISHSSNNRTHFTLRMDESTETLHIPKQCRSHSASTSLRSALKLGQTLERNVITLLLKQSFWDRGIVITSNNPSHISRHNHDSNIQGEDLKFSGDNEENDDSSMEEEEVVEIQEQTNNSNNHDGVVMMDMVEDE